jgi:Fic family protein
MQHAIHTFFLSLNMKLINKISRVDRFDASWSAIEKREGHTLKQLKTIATVRSVGASTRIEGSKMTDAEVAVLIEKLNVSKLDERDEQEVAGYYEALETICTSFDDIDITEGNIKNLHAILMKHCEKDKWHSGDYKQVSNAVAATYSDGTRKIIFKTAEPGFETEEAMRKLFAWYKSDKETLSIIKCALFVYDFLSIHPFQDGNGRLSRLLGTLLLLKHGYSWIQYVSFEHEIEFRKADYYSVLMQTQRQRPGEKVDAWLNFFLDCLMKIQSQLMEKLRSMDNAALSGTREKNILAVIANNPGIRSGEIAKKLNFPSPTVKKILSSLVERKIILKSGAGAGTNYLAEIKSPVKKDLMFQLSSKNKSSEFILKHQSNFVEIKKIILTPLFAWTKPDEWSARLIKQGLSFEIKMSTGKKTSFTNKYALAAFVNPHLFQPVFNLVRPINIPSALKEKSFNLNEYPVKVSVKLLSRAKKIDFEVMFVYDGMLD